MKVKFCIASLLFLSHVSLAATTEEIITNCNSCHGENGVSTDADIPTIAGYSETSTSDMLFAFIDEVRPARKSKYRHGDLTRAETDMRTIAKELSETQIEEIALHYSEQTYLPAKQTFDAALAAKGKKTHEVRCTKCHDEGGSLADDDAGMLAGQWGPYLEEAFSDYRSGKRDGEEEMLKKLNKLSDAQVAALIHYYKSQQ